MPQRSLIAIFILLFIGSALFLFWRNDTELDPNSGKSWWILSFAAPENLASLTFTIENYSDNTEFQYEVIANKQKIGNETFEVKRGEKKTLTPAVSAHPETRTSIIVTTGKEKKEIYR